MESPLHRPVARADQYINPAERSQSRRTERRRRRRRRGVRRRRRREATLLQRLAVCRPTFRPNALSLVLYYATSGRPLTRIYAIKTARHLLQHFGDLPVGTYSDVPLKQLIVNYAKKSLTKIVSHAEALAVAAQAEEPAAQAQRRRERIVARHSSLFLVLCSIDEHIALIANLLDVFCKCGATAAGAEGRLLQQVILENRDILPLFSALCSPGSTRWIKAMTKLVNFPKGAEALVVRILEVFAGELRKHAYHATQQSAGGVTPPTQLKFIEALQEQSKRLFEKDHDIRFLVPVMGFLPRSYLKETALPSLLSVFGADSDSEVARTRDQTLQAAIESMISETGLVFPKAGNDQAPDPRGFALVDLFVHLHLIGVISATDSAASKRGAKQAIACIDWIIQKLRMPTQRDTFTLALGHQEAIVAMNTMASMRPIPTLTMRTALLLSKPREKDAMSGTTTQTVKKFVVTKMLVEMTKQAVWNSDPDLWRGVMKFFESHWGSQLTLRDVSQSMLGILINLPEQVLVQCLRERPTLKEKFALEARTTIPAKLFETLMLRVESGK